MILTIFLFPLALKADRRRLKAEKFDLLNQMKQLYATLEDKEKELRDFIRNYEQVKTKKLFSLCPVLILPIFIYILSNFLKTTYLDTSIDFFYSFFH